MSDRPADVPANRCSTPFGVTDFCGVKIGGEWIAKMECSTPFGVTDFCGTAAGFRLGLLFRVLNAFRRH